MAMVWSKKPTSLAVTPIKTLHGFYISLHQIETCDKCLEIDMSFLALRGAGLQGSLDARRLLLNSLMQLFRIVQPNLPSLSSIYNPRHTLFTRTFPVHKFWGSNCMRSTTTHWWSGPRSFVLALLPAAACKFVE